MRVKVLKKFRDARTKEVRNIGSVFECSKERYEEIVAAGEYVENIPDGESELVCDIAQMTLEDLKKMAKEKKVKNYSSMSKEQLIKELS